MPYERVIIIWQKSRKFANASKYKATVLFRNWIKMRIILQCTGILLSLCLMGHCEEENIYPRLTCRQMPQAEYGNINITSLGFETTKTLKTINEECRVKAEKDQCRFDICMLNQLNVIQPYSYQHHTDDEEDRYDIAPKEEIETSVAQLFSDDKKYLASRMAVGFRNWASLVPSKAKATCREWQSFIAQSRLVWNKCSG